MKERLRSFRKDIEGRIVERIEAKVEEIRRPISTNWKYVVKIFMQLGDSMDDKSAEKTRQRKGILWKRSKETACPLNFLIPFFTTPEPVTVNTCQSCKFEGK